MTEKNIKIFNDNITLLNLDLTSFWNKTDDLINSKVYSFLNEKMKCIDDVIKDENNILKKGDNNDILFEKNKKFIEEIKQEKIKYESNNNKEKLESIQNKNNSLEERIKNLLEEQKASKELIDLKNKELEKANKKIKNMEDKIYDISEFIKTKCKNEIFIKKIVKICNLDNLK